jgi:hypothetical protein
MAVISTLTDNFDNNSLDTGKWTSAVGGTTTIAETNSTLVVTFPALSTALDVGKITSVSTYDLTGSSAFVEVKTLPLHTTTANAILQVITDSNNWFRWVYEQGILYAHRRKAGAQATVTQIGTVNQPLDLSTYKQWRILESGGTIFYDTSDGTTWTNRGTYVHGMTITAMSAVLEGSTYEVVATAGTVVFDNFNMQLNVAPTSWLTA